LSGRLRECTRILTVHPRIGKPVPETTSDRIRELVTGKYRVIYWLLQDERIEVIAVHHAKRELPAQRLVRRISTAARRRSGTG
jgi:plasmid stabilization system protein ParE